MRDLSDEQLDALAIEELIRLSDRIHKFIAIKVNREKKALKEKLVLIEQYESRGASALDAAKPRFRSKRSKATPKYRDPDTGLTWSGRGMVPRWLNAALARGHNRDDFLIVTTVPRKAGNGSHAL
jgi:DNA-binding protein H-NS